MAKQDTQIKATYYVGCACLYVLTRYLGIVPRDLSLLIGGIILSWSISLPLTSLNWLYDRVFDIFDEPLAKNVTDWINERTYPDGLMHFFGLFGSEYIVPTDHEGLVEVLSTRSYDYEKSRAFRRYSVRFFGDSLVTQEQEVHNRNRKTFMPVFNQTNINIVRPLLTAKSRQFNDYISSVLTDVGESQKGSRGGRTAIVPITDIVFRATMDTGSILALGIDLETIKGRNTHMLRAFKTLFASNRQKKIRFVLHNLLPSWIDRLIPSEEEKSMDRAKSLIVDSVVDMMQGKMAENEVTDGHLTYLSNLIRSGRFNHDEYIGQLRTIIAAGFESSGGSLSFVIYCLAANQGAQNSVREELYNAKHGKVELEEDEYDRLPVLNAMVMESLRLFPSFGLLLRRAIRDTTIKGRFIPRGTHIGICPKAINCSRHLWGDDAEDFNLERWIDRSDPNNPTQKPTGGAPSPACMLSFGYGTRSCVGRHLAMAQIKRQIALIVERFHVETEDDRFPHPSGLFASNPPFDFRLRFTEVKYGKKAV
ncbi:cytochrome P450 [Aspergillus luchuensis]|uniref:Cytochrome P450 n=1 Tax=Aspergillus kawachii TaxID=1069201 RepID=A0A146EZJ3_ASPKA|nr:cytochrome P450 [Aspergillus luchuensis]